jgi:hypothetical protein
MGYRIEDGDHVYWVRYEAYRDGIAVYLDNRRHVPIAVLPAPDGDQTAMKIVQDSRSGLKINGVRVSPPVGPPSLWSYACCCCRLFRGTGYQRVTGWNRSL